MAKVTSFVASGSSEGLRWMSWAAKCTATIQESDLELEFGNDSEKVQNFGA